MEIRDYRILLNSTTFNERQQLKVLLISLGEPIWEHTSIFDGRNYYKGAQYQPSDGWCGTDSTTFTDSCKELISIQECIAKFGGQSLKDFYGNS